jgi:hypothetical protein
LRGFQIEIENGDPRAVFGEQARRGPAKTAQGRRTGDDGNPVLEQHQFPADPCRTSLVIAMTK